MSGNTAPVTRLDLEELYAEYGDCLSEGELEHWPELFLPECLYRITSRENHERGLPLALVLCESRNGLRDRVMAIRRTSVYRPRRMRHLFGNLRLVAREAGGAIRSRTSFVVFETLLGEETRLFASGSSYDQVVRDGDSLRFRERVCVLDSSLVPGSLVFPL